MDKLSIRNHIHVDGYGYGHRPRVVGATPWEKRLAPSSAYQPEPPRDAVLEMVVVMDTATGYGVEYEVLICADFIPAQNGGMWDPSWPAHFAAPEAWYHREGRGWKRLELDRQARSQVQRELDREMDYVEVYGREP